MYIAVGEKTARGLQAGGKMKMEDKTQTVDHAGVKRRVQTTDLLSLTYRVRHNYWMRFLGNPNRQRCSRGYQLKPKAEPDNCFIIH